MWMCGFPPRLCPVTCSFCCIISSEANESKFSAFNVNFRDQPRAGFAGIHSDRTGLTFFDVEVVSTSCLSSRHRVLCWYDESSNDDSFSHFTVVFFRYFAICRQQESEKKEETLEHLIVFRFCGERRGSCRLSHSCSLASVSISFYS